jgi:hypothetical protein
MKGQKITPGRFSVDKDTTKTGPESLNILIDAQIGRLKYKQIIYICPKNQNFV